MLIVIIASFFLPGIEEERLVEAARTAAELTLAKALPQKSKQELEVVITLTDDQTIRALNSQYRGFDESTDVLSFPMGEEEPQPDGSVLFWLGDVVISLETAARQAEAAGRSLTLEVSHLVAHGVLHLLGYDHQEEEEARDMQRIEKAVLEAMEGE